jgi:hypothetical protein
MTTKERIAKYGKPNQTGDGYLVTIQLPYPMRLAWDIDTVVHKMRCHKLVADKFLNVFNELMRVYGYNKIKELGIDLFGGCFNFRKMRAANDWSTHSWAIAIDLDPSRNGMNTKITKAQFSKPEYKQMIEIFKKHGFEWGGDLWEKDCMHFQIKG